MLSAPLCCDPTARTLEYRLAPDFPSVAPEDAGRPYRFAWALGISQAGRKGRKFFDQLVRLDWDRPARCDIYQSPAHTYLAGEPVFVPSRGRAGSGAILCPIFDASRIASAFLVFDAFDLALNHLQ